MTAITPEIVREHVLRYVAESLAPREMSTLDLPEEFDLLGEGVLDSFGVLELISSIESRFKIEVDFEQLDAGDITVIGPLCRYVAAHATNGPDEKETETAAALSDEAASANQNYSRSRRRVRTATPGSPRHRPRQRR